MDKYKILCKKYLPLFMSKGIEYSYQNLIFIIPNLSLKPNILDILNFDC